MRKLAATVEAISYDGNTDSMREVETGKIDATVQDTPIASFYLPRFPKLRRVGGPVGEGYYVIYARKGEAELVAALNEALIVMIRGGELERLYRKYGIWDQAQERLSDFANAGKFYGLAGAVNAASGIRGVLPGAEEVHIASRPRGWPVVRDYAGILIQSAAMIVVTHLMSFARNVAATVHVFAGGMDVEAGPPEQVFGDPQHPITRSFLREAG